MRSENLFTRTPEEDIKNKKLNELKGTIYFAKSPLICNREKQLKI